MSYTNDILRFAEDFEKLAKKKGKKKKKPREDFIFPSSHSKVKKGDHFPINTEGRGRNALSRANQYSKAPSWYTGSLSSLVQTVARAVGRKYKDIEVSEASKVPGKGGGKKKADVEHKLTIHANWIDSYDFNDDPESVYDYEDFEALGYE